MARDDLFDASDFGHELLIMQGPWRGTSGRLWIVRRSVGFECRDAEALVATRHNREGLMREGEPRVHTENSHLCGRTSIRVFLCAGEWVLIQNGALARFYRERCCWASARLETCLTPPRDAWERGFSPIQTSLTERGLLQR
ncbi:hypothetical protein V2G26_020348 [Clonostachys chloroleuca]